MVIIMSKDKTLNHLALILDGNGRWAKAQGKPRTFGHEKGLEKIKLVSEEAIKHKVKYVTLYTFSTENWKRPTKEVNFLWKFPEKHFDKFLKEYQKWNVKINLIGERSRIPAGAMKAFDDAIEKTKDNDGLILTFAMNYGSRDEITRTVNKLIKEGKEVTEQDIEDNLDTAGLPPVDLLVRTSGEQRISNFLLWQIAYAEVLFVDYNWPEMSEENFTGIIEEYNNRTRTYGGLKDED